MAQNTNKRIPEKFTFELCVFKKGKPGYIIQNETIDIRDTTLANVSGQVLEKNEILPFASILFTDSLGQQTVTTTDINGGFQLFVPPGEYAIKFSYVGFNDFLVDKTKFVRGQMQKLVVNLGSGSGYYTYEVTFKEKPTQKEIKAMEKKLAED